MNRIVRVAVSNNFNCTKREWNQLQKLNEKYPESVFFVNCNVHTPKLETINDHPFKAVITANPNLRVPKAVSRLDKISPEKIAFIRVKYVPGMKGHKELIASLSQQGLNVVITNQRWNGLKNLLEYTAKHYYTWSHNRFRLIPEEQAKIEEYADSFENVYICDRVGGGCGACRLCSFIPTGENLKISSVNLSSSGLCRYNCPDCYAKAMQQFCVNFGNTPIRFDTIKANTKQSGKTVHIQETLQKLEA